MTGVERITSLRVLERARDYEAALQLFLRQEFGLTRTGFTSTVLDLGTRRARRLIVETPVRHAAPYPLHPGDAVEFFFEIDGVGYAFPATVRERVRYPLNDLRTIGALLLDYPDDLLKIQRRQHYRAAPPVSPPITVQLRLVSADESTEDRMFAAEYPYAGRLLDISGSGIAVAVSEPAAWEPDINTVLTVHFRLPDEPGAPIALDTRVRGITNLDDGEGTVLHLAWINCREDDVVTGAVATRIFRYVAQRQQALAHERGGRSRRG